jgi:hypothetical protein
LDSHCINTVETRHAAFGARVAPTPGLSRRSGGFFTRTKPHRRFSRCWVKDSWGHVLVKNRSHHRGKPGGVGRQQFTCYSPPSRKIQNI